MVNTGKHMANVEDILAEIVNKVAEKVSDDDLSLEDLNLAAVVLMNVKEREKMENVLADRA